MRCRPDFAALVRAAAQPGETQERAGLGSHDETYGFAASAACVPFCFRTDLGGCATVTTGPLSTANQWIDYTPRRFLVSTRPELRIRAKRVATHGVSTCPITAFTRTLQPVLSARCVKRTIPMDPSDHGAYSCRRIQMAFIA